MAILLRSFCSFALTLGVLLLVVVDAAPPDVTILSPPAGTTFSVGQIFHLRGQAVDSTTGQDIDSSNLRWEVEYHYEDSNEDDEESLQQTKIFMNSRVGNNIVMRPAPRPHVPFFVGVAEGDNPSSSTPPSSFLRIILHATDPSTGDASVKERIVFPSIATVDVRTVPPGLDVVVNEYLLHELHTGTPSSVGTTNTLGNNVNVDEDEQLELQTWKGSEVVVQTGNQRPYIFSSWSDGSTDRKRTIKLTEDYQEIVALFCLYEDATCQTDADCCSGQCSSSSMTCLPSPNTDTTLKSFDGDSGGMSRSATITLSVLFALALVMGIAILVVLQRRRNYLRYGCGFKTDDSGDDTSSNNDSHSNKNKDNNSSDGETDDASQEKKKQTFKTLPSEDVVVVDSDVEAPSPPPSPSQEDTKSTTKKTGMMSTMRSIFHTVSAAAITRSRKAFSSTKDDNGSITPASDTKDIIAAETHDPECHSSNNKGSVAVSSSSDNDKQLSGGSKSSKSSKPDEEVGSTSDGGGRIGTTISVETKNKTRPGPATAAILDMTGTISSSSSRSKERNEDDNDGSSSSSSSGRPTTTRRNVVRPPPAFMFTELE